MNGHGGLFMSIEYRSEQERLVAEQAVLVYRAVQSAMLGAPQGRGLEVTEAALMENGREHLRNILAQALSTHPEVQKGGPAPGGARVGATPRSSTIRPTR
jgi:hypothetical protein